MMNGLLRQDAQETATPLLQHQLVPLLFVFEHVFVSVTLADDQHLFQILRRHDQDFPGFGIGIRGDRGQHRPIGLQVQKLSLLLGREAEVDQFMCEFDIGRAFGNDEPVRPGDTVLESVSDGRALLGRCDFSWNEDPV